MFAIVKDGVVIRETSTIPESIETISGFNLLPVTEHIKHGYYPVDVVNHEFDLSSQELSESPIYTVQAHRVVAEYIPKTLSLDRITIDVELARIKMCTKLDIEYSGKIEFPVPYLGKQFHADKKSYNTIISILSAMNDDDVITWFVLNGEIEMSRAELHGLANLIFKRNQILFKQNREIKDLIKNAKDIAEIGEVKIEFINE